MSQNEVLCPRCLFAEPRCRCIKGGGKEEGGGEEKRADKEEVLPFKTELTAEMKALNIEAQRLQQEQLPKQNPNDIKPLDDKIDRELLASLFNSKFLTFENDPEGMGILRIRCLPQHLTSLQNYEVQKYVDAVRELFEQFAKDHNLSKDNASIKINKDSHGNIMSLKVSIANPALYDLFLTKLGEKRLLQDSMKQSMKFAQTYEDQKTQDDKLRRRNFPPKLKPGGSKNRKDQDQ